MNQDKSKELHLDKIRKISKTKYNTIHKNRTFK